MNLKKITSKIENDGYTIIKKAFSKKKINFILDLVNKEHSKLKFKYKGLPKRDSKDLIVYNLQNKNYEFLKLLSNPIIQKICKYFLNDNFFRLIKRDKPNFNKIASSIRVIVFVPKDLLLSKSNGIRLNKSEKKTKSKKEINNRIK